MAEPDSARDFDRAFVPGGACRIAGTGHAVPAGRLTNADLEARVETSDEWIVARTGIRERPMCDESEYTSMFAVEAGKAALDMAGLEPADVDLIVCATVTPDMLFPSTACVIQEGLGAKNAAAFDINAGCSGFVYGLQVASQFIAGGGARRVLLIGAETLTKIVDWEDRSTCVLFGDGAGAAVIEAADVGPGEGILGTAIHSDGAFADLIEMPAGGSRIPPATPGIVEKRLPFIKMRGNEVFKVAVRTLAQTSETILDRCGLTDDQVRWMIPHQANGRIIQAVGQRLGLAEERVYTNVERFGNTSAASIPIALDELNRAGQIAPGDVVLMAAFGAGLTWGSAGVRW